MSEEKITRPTPTIEQRKLAIDYRNAIRAAMNDNIPRAQVAEAFKLQQSDAYHGVNAVSAVADLVPVFGNLVGGAMRVANSGFQAVADHKKRQNYDNFLEANQSHDPQEFAAFAKAVGTNLAYERLSQLELLGEDERAKLAQTDAKILIEIMNKGKTGPIINDNFENDHATVNLDTVEKLKKDVIEKNPNPEKTLPTKALKQPQSSTNTHEHKVVGSFTAKIVHKENDELRNLSTAGIVR
jgi:hypothetical protein